MAFSWKRPFIAAIILGTLLPPSSFGGETIVLNVILNSETKGEFFVNIADDRDFLIRVEDLKAMGFRDPVGKIIDIAGERYISLGSIRGVDFVFSERDVTLEINASPDLLPKTAIDFTFKMPSDIYYPRDNSAFLNYGLDYSKSTPPDAYNFSVTNQVGVRVRDFLLLSDSAYSKNEDDERFVRLMSNATYDRREDMQRIVVGDSSASSGDLGSSINMGGLSFSKVYQINPYFIRYPTLDISGLIPLPSEMEVYLNGMLVRRERLSPGGFEIRNISYYGGAGLVEIVITDPFGRRQRIIHPFYLSDLLLRKGLHEYSYNMGLAREKLGIESNRYGDPVFSAFHRYGMSDYLTVGLRGEGTNGLYNIGPQFSYNTGGIGVVSVSLSGSDSEAEGSGFAASLNYGYFGRRSNARLLLRGFTEEYLTISAYPESERARYEVGVGIGFAGRIGSISLDYTIAEDYRDGERREAAATSYTRTLSDNLTVFATLKNRYASDQGTENEVFVGLNYYMGGNTSLSSQFQKSDEKDVEMVQIQKNPPVGEGYGYRLSLQRTGSSQVSYRLNPNLRYNSRFAIFEGEYRGDYSGAGDVESYRVSASGGIAYIGNTIGFSRPFSDSFGLVKVGDVEGVRAYLNNQEIGRTDSSGRIFVPNMTSYHDNLIAINDKDIPIDYHISRVSEVVSPPIRSGTCIIFDAYRIQAVVGYLKMKEGPVIRPLEFHDITMKVGEKEVHFQTGRGGEFYFENVIEMNDPYERKGCSYIKEAGKVLTIKPGAYEASFDHEGRRCGFYVTVPESDEMAIDLGEITCDMGPITHLPRSR